jgi:D-glycero-D-manno-heptose 1,7-bisphosphate phosphatase
LLLGSPVPTHADSSLAYLARLGVGQARLLLSRERITPELLASLDPAEQQALEGLRRALAFGESLGLARTTSYRDLVGDREGGLVHVVTAAPVNQVEPLSWWFPITGRVSYRGYFQKERADGFAAELQAEGYDTYVRPAPLYSTLGWFDDPVARAVLAWPENDRIDTFLHELVHQTVFVPGDVAYDEALATFIAHHATLAFFAEQPELRARAEAGFADELSFARMLGELRQELERVYAGAAIPEQARRLRAPVFARFQGEVYPAQPWRSRRYARFPELALSNAWLVAQRTYVTELPCFAAELERWAATEACARAPRPSATASATARSGDTKVTQPARTLCLLDRDGTLLEEREYAYRAADYAVLPGAHEAVARLRAAGFGVVVITNQSGIGRGLFSGADYADFEAILLRDFEAHGAKLDGCYHCPHTPEDACGCRKPGTALALRAARDLGIDLARSWVIGDKDSDVALARSLGCRAVLVLTGHGAEHRERLPEGTRVARDLPDAVSRFVLASAPAQCER